MFSINDMNTSYHNYTALVFTKSLDSNFRAFCFGSCNSEHPCIFTVLLTERKMARHFTKVSEEEIEEAYFFPSDLVNT